MAAPGKTASRSLFTLQAVAHQGTVISSVIDVSTLISALIDIRHAITEATANTNAGSFQIQVSAASSGDDDWQTVHEIGVSEDSPATEALTATEPIAETVLAVTLTAGFVATDYIFILDAGTVGDSLWRQLQEISTDASVTIYDGLTTAKDSSDTIWGSAQRFVYFLDLFAVQRVRLVYQHEGGTGANVHIMATMGTGDTFA